MIISKRKKAPCFRVAFAKGRGAAECIRLLEADKIAIPPAFYDGRLTACSTNELLCVIVRGRDISQLLHEGRVDVALGSNLVFEEYGSPDIYPAASLDIGRCRLSLITRAARSRENLGTICTRYPNLTRKRLDGLPNLRILQWSGCVEAALFLGLCDAITEIVETGWTLKALALQEHEVLGTFTHGIWLRHADKAACIEKLRILMPSVIGREQKI